eukprot:gnl/Hemi2/15307_TR5157_c0_g10_i1.p1 gnl/Hemi2/15307_TR5157_c0_g10~~gnl/Hemi2/15307_TR5157_c0_g10_i1.p1  ORF type:complete len:274 (+),score=69.05 gnl/Hemi2/15307_TR5157_c0_g10_i1:94-915(+)
MSGRHNTNNNNSNSSSNGSPPSSASGKKSGADSTRSNNAGGAASDAGSTASKRSAKKSAASTSGGSKPSQSSSSNNSGSSSQHDWAALSESEVLQVLGSHALNGLAAPDAKTRLDLKGRNVLPLFESPNVGDDYDFTLESADGTKINPPYCWCIRDGMRRKTKTSEIVPGDILHIYTSSATNPEDSLPCGHVAPADCKILHTTTAASVVQVHLTGDVVAQPKAPGDLLLASCAVVSSKPANFVVVVVVATGLDTYWAGVGGQAVSCACACCIM